MVIYKCMLNDYNHNGLWGSPELIKPFKVDDILQSLPTHFNHTVSTLQSNFWSNDPDNKHEFCTIDLPGIPKSKITIDVLGNVLKISATRYYVDGTKKSHDREIKVPSHLDPSSVEAKLEDGVLTIKVKKKETKMDSIKRVTIS
jgi:HSP20 family molecular chaperone IbpA